MIMKTKKNSMMGMKTKKEYQQDLYQDLYEGILIMSTKLVLVTIEPNLADAAEITRLAQEDAEPNDN